MTDAARVLDEHGELQAHCFQIGNARAVDDALRPMAPSPPLRIESAAVRHPLEDPVRGQLKVRPTSETLSTAQLVRQLRARLRVVEREIRARKKLEDERNQIKRLLSAAITERDNVRRLRSAG